MIPSSNRIIQLPKIVQIIGVFILSVCALYLREPKGFTNPQFWAEDGLVFFSQAYHQGIHSILIPYAGYHHFVLRVAAYSATLVSPVFAPTFYLGFCLLVHLFLIALLFSPRVRFPYKPLVALAIVLLPTRNELFLSLTNTQWLLALAQLLIIVSEAPTSRRGQIFDLLMVGILGLTGPFIILLLPLYFLRLAMVRSRFNALLITVAAVTAGVQLLNIGESVATNSGPWEWFDYVRIWTDYFWRLLFGSEGNWSEQSVSYQSLFALTGMVIYAAFLLTAIKTQNRAVLFLMLGGLLILMGSIAKFTPNPRLMLVAGERYFYIPSVTLVWSALGLLPTLRAGRLFLLLIVCNLLFLDMRFHKDQLVNFKWKRHARCIGVKEECYIPVNPPGWKIGIFKRARDLRHPPIPPLPNQP